MDGVVELILIWLWSYYRHFRNVKDLIILTSGTQVLSLISNWFWFLLLLAPARAVWMLWGSVIQPWLNQRNEQPEVDEKKQKKLERKAKREQKFRWIYFVHCSLIVWMWIVFKMQVFSVCDFLNSIVWMRYIECNTWISFFLFSVEFNNTNTDEPQKNCLSLTKCINLYLFLNENQWNKKWYEFFEEKKTKFGLKFPFILLLQLLLLMFRFLLNYWTFWKEKRKPTTIKCPPNCEQKNDDWKNSFAQ